MSNREITLSIVIERSEELDYRSVIRGNGYDLWESRYHDSPKIVLEKAAKLLAAMSTDVLHAIQRGNKLDMTHPAVAAFR